MTTTTGMTRSVLAHPQSNQRLRMAGIFLVFVLLGLGSGYQLGRYLKSLEKAPTVDTWVFLAIPVLLWLGIALHEAGHLIGGWSAGFATVLFAAGPLKLQRIHDRWEARWNRSFALWGGVAATAPWGSQPPSPDFMRRAMLRVVAGGPVASLAGALLLAPGILLLQENPNLSALLSVFGAFSLLLGLVTVVPATAGGFLSDGARLLQLFRNGDDAKRWSYLATLSGLSTTVRPRDWSAELVYACTRTGDETYDGVSAAWLRSTWHQDRNEIDAALVWIEKALAGIDNWPKPARPMIHATAAYLYALQNDPRQARSHLDAASTAGFLEKEHLKVCQSAVLLAEGRTAEARQLAAEGLALLPKNAAGPTLVQREGFERVLGHTG